MPARTHPCTRAGISVALLVAVASPLLAQAGWSVSSGEIAVVCPLTVGGSFEAKSPSLSGQLTADPSQPGRLQGELTVDLATLDTGIGLRNTHMRDNYLEVGRGEGYSRAVLKDIVLASDPATATGATTFTATLLVHGVERPVRGDARLARDGDRVRVDASFPVVLAEHEIPKPRYLGVGVRDQVQVKVRFQTSASGGATGSSR
jgi:polyisoprenoid-binding protein YceI